MEKNKLPDIHALWVGSRLKESDIACLESFTHHGHAVYLHVYEPIQNLLRTSPLKVVDARKIIPEEKVKPFIQGKRLALFSDIFRFLLLASFEEKCQGIWVDCDVYCLKPIRIPEHGYLLGYQNAAHTEINGAILALPPNSKLLRTLINRVQKERAFGTLFASKMRILFWKWGGKLLSKPELEWVEWSAYGPELLTNLVNAMGLQSYCQPYDVFYPVPWEEATKFADPSYTLVDLVTQNTIAVHLFNEILTRSDSYHNLAPDSVVGKIISGELE